MRIIIILLVMIFVYMIARSLVTKKKGKNKTEIKYCKYCKAYVISNEICSMTQTNYKNCKNYKWEIND